MIKTQDIVQLELVYGISIQENIYVRDGVPKGVVPIKGVPIYMPILDDSIPKFTEAGRQINIHGPPLWRKF